MAEGYLSVIDEKSVLIDEISDSIWDFAETTYAEFNSSKCLCDALSGEGFTVSRQLGGIPTAFSGSYGKGRPVIAVIGEFDALSGLSQEAGNTERCPLKTGNGHGCGHNQLGAGSFAAALAVKKYLEENKCDGTVVYYGCPAEECGAGKSFMVKSGVFDDVDAALYWHPSDVTCVRPFRNLANTVVDFTFDGQAAHAGSHPHLGRSALDAVELMNVGVQFLREHIISDARVHYAFKDAGGSSPNVVHPHSEIQYLLRAPDIGALQEIKERVIDIAKGAALMTGTTVNWKEGQGASNIVLNTVLMKVLHDQLEQTEMPAPSESELAFARQLSQTALAGYPGVDSQMPYDLSIKPLDLSEKLKFTSNDLGDVSWICPTVQLYASCQVRGTPNHSWQLTAQGKSSFGHKMLRYAGKVLARTAVELINHPSVIEEAKCEQKKRIGDTKYVSPIPDNIDYPFTVV